MSELKRYWVVIHYETEIEAETEWEACHEIRLGNTLVENATLIAKELPTQSSGFKEGVHPKVANCLQRRSLRLYKLNPPARVLRQSA